MGRTPAFLQATALLLAAALPFGGAGAQEQRGSDYPTSAIADYVYACMKANGESQEALSACSCSLDVVSSILPYQRYVEASTFLSMSQLAGETVGLFKESAEAKAAVGDLRRAQAEGEVRCFISSSS